MMKKISYQALRSALFENYARIAKALSSPIRLEVVQCLAQGERNVDQIAAFIGQSVANTSQHLQILKSVHLVEAHREGQYVYYRLASRDVFELWQILQRSAQVQLSEVSALLKDLTPEGAEYEIIDQKALLKKLEDGEIILLDVRPETEYHAAHIKGARSLPADALADRIDELPTDKPVVVYCRGRHCLLAHNALEAIIASGRTGARLEGGFPDWVVADLPIEAATVAS